MSEKIAGSFGINKRQKALLAATAASVSVAAAFIYLMINNVINVNIVRTEAATIGSLAPDFELKDLDGRTVRLADFRGKDPIFLNFWASWCPACRQEAPENERLRQKLGPKGLRFLAVSIDQGPTAADEVRKFVGEFKLGFIPVLDPGHEVMDLYGVTAIPTTFLIERGGKVVSKEVGPKNWTNPEWLGRLERLLE